VPGRTGFPKLPAFGIVFLAVPDQAIAEVAATIARLEPSGRLSFVHLSGALGLDALSALHQYPVGSFHPLQSFPAPRNPEAFRGITVAVDASTQALIDWYGTFRGRLGTTIGSFLLYATAGVAYGNVALNSTFSAFGLTTHSQALQTKVGGVVGAGFEYIMMPNLMLTFGYQFVDLGRISIASSTSGTFGCCVSSALSQTATAHAQFQVAMVGLSWRFAPDGSPSPWAGGYAGGHVGGAWGNNASATYNGSTRFVGD